MQQQREALNAAGISTKTLSSEQQRLKTASAQATVSLSRQKMELQRLNQQQERLNQTSERYRRGQELSGRVRNTGAAALGAATVGGMAATSVLRPGYDFALANSTLQAVTGLDKNQRSFSHCERRPAALATPRPRRPMMPPGRRLLSPSQAATLTTLKPPRR